MINFQVAAGFATMISCTIGANILMKVGSGPGHARWLFGFAGTYSILGATLFGAALLLYIWILRKVPLNIAQCVMAAQFIGVILAAAYFLSEPIPPLRWIGILLISLGIALVGFTAAGES